MLDIYVHWDWKAIIIGSNVFLSLLVPLIQKSFGTIFSFGVKGNVEVIQR